MKVLWFCNLVPSRISSHVAGRHFSPSGGWIEGLLNSLPKNNEIDISIAFPLYGSKTIISGEVDEIKYFAFPQIKSDINKYNPKTRDNAESIINRVSPDIIHIFGTEYIHTLAIINACEKLEILNKIVVSIQGLVSILSRNYYAGLPQSVVYRYTFRDFIKQDNIRQQRKKYIERGKYEIEALQKVRHVVGRTDWDKACTSQINPLAQYHFCNETLRDEFYKHSWELDKCERYSIFISQASYPIKGLHFALEALPEIIKRFPSTHLYIAGVDITRDDSLISRIKMSYYGKYIKKLIRKKKLQRNITFTGPLDEKAMCERFIGSHVFVSPSTMENESNSVSEAKLLGVPVVTSFVGGVAGRLINNESGFLYQHDAPYMLTYYICRIFENDDLAHRLSENAKKHAATLHDPEANLEQILQIYGEILV